MPENLSGAQCVIGNSNGKLRLLTVSVLVKPKQPQQVDVNAALIEASRRLELFPLTIFHSLVLNISFPYFPPQYIQNFECFTGFYPPPPTSPQNQFRYLVTFVEERSKKNIFSGKIIVAHIKKCWGKCRFFCDQDPCPEIKGVRKEKVIQERIQMFQKCSMISRIHLQLRKGHKENPEVVLTNQRSKDDLRV